MIKRIIKKLLIGKRDKVSAEAALHKDAYLGDWSDYKAIKQNAIFTIGVGRSGTHFMAKLLGEDSKINAFHLDDIKDAVGDAFLFYSEYYGLPVDNFGFLASRNHLIESSKSQGKLYFESNPYISFSVDSLKSEFDGKFIYMYRNPLNVVNSHVNKGWYSQIPGQRDFSSALGYQYYMRQSNHFFGRITPKTRDEFDRWKALTQVGRVAWKWNMMNEGILERLAPLDENDYWKVYLDDFDYSRYKEIHDFVGGETLLTEEGFDGIRASKPGKGIITRKVSDWSALEMKEFEEETLPARTKLGLV